MDSSLSSECWEDVGLLIVVDKRRRVSLKNLTVVQFSKDLKKDGRIDRQELHGRRSGDPFERSVLLLDELQVGIENREGRSRCRGCAGG